MRRCRRVFAEILSIAGLGLAGNAFDVAQKETREIEHVNSDIEDCIALRLMQIRLDSVNIVASPEGDARPRRLADRSAIDNALRLAHRRLPAEILVDRESDARPMRDVDDFARFVPIGRQWFLQDDIDAMRRCELDHIEMAFHPRHDVDEIDLLPS
jgi:hypothetical protein